MALERSVLNPERIAELMKTHYGISVQKVEKLGLGTANCYRIEDGMRPYFLKEFQSGISEADVIREAKLLEYLSGAEIPVVPIYRTVSGNFTLCEQDKILCLEEYAQGETYGYENLPEELLPQIAGMLGRLHRALKDYPLPTDMQREWLEAFSAPKLAAQYGDLLEVVRSQKKEDKTGQIVADLEYKKALAYRCEEYKKYYSSITYCPTHGDYQGCQLIFNGNVIRAVVDFSSARTLPAVWEVMRSFVQSSRRCRKDATVEIADLCAYVGEYRRHAPLTATDLQAMPYVYLFQLARSKYGYPQYLLLDSEDREGLLRFAFWRTQMCREVEAKAEAIAEALVRKFG